MNSIRQRLAVCVLWAATLMPAQIVTSGESLVRWTARHAVAFWFVAMLLRIDGRGAWARLFWTLACVSFLVHVGAAFEETHHWSHTAAFEHVRRESGVGEGIFFSYFFTLLWVVDVVWWNGFPTSYRERPKWLSRAILGFMVFIVFNGTVVYENGPIRWVGLVGFAALGWRASRVTASVGA